MKKYICFEQPDSPPRVVEVLEEHLANNIWFKNLFHYQEISDLDYQNIISGKYKGTISILDNGIKHLEIISLVSFEEIKTNFLTQVAAFYSLQSGMFKYRGKSYNFYFDLRERFREISPLVADNQPIDFFISNDRLTFNKSDWQRIITAVSNNAIEIFRVYQSHLSAIEAIEDKEALDAYDYTANYPKPIIVEVLLNIVADNT